MDDELEAEILATTTGEEESLALRRVSRWALIRDTAVFQVKLALDGILDLVIGPATLVVGLLAVITGRPRAAELFYDVLRAGLRVDRWINLFGAAKEKRPVQGVDVALEKVELYLVDKSERESIARKAKLGVDNVLDRVQQDGRPKK